MLDANHVCYCDKKWRFGLASQNLLLFDRLLWLLCIFLQTNFVLKSWAQVEQFENNKAYKLKGKKCWPIMGRAEQKRWIWGSKTASNEVKFSLWTSYMYLNGKIIGFWWSKKDMIFTDVTFLISCIITLYLLLCKKYSLVFPRLRGSWGKIFFCAASDIIFSIFCSCTHAQPFISLWEVLVEGFVFIFWNFTTNPV